MSIQAVQRAGASKQQVYAAARESLYAREAAALARRRAAVRTREAARRTILSAAGLLYRAPETWARYQLGPEMRAVFDGDWPAASAHWQFGMLYARTVRAFSNRCRRLIPPGSPMEIEKWVRRDEAGNKWERDGSDTTFILEAFVQPYRWWHAASPMAMPLSPPGLRAGSVSDVLTVLTALSTRPGDAMREGALLARVAVALREDMALLFEDGCESAAVRQFMENMRRFALRLPSLQAERAPRALPAMADWPASIERSCQQHESERGAQPSRAWCPCLARELGRQMTLGEQWNALENYHTFFDEVAGFRRAADGAPVWVRYTPANACRN